MREKLRSHQDMWSERSPWIWSTSHQTVSWDVMWLMQREISFLSVIFAEERRFNRQTSSSSLVSSEKELSSYRERKWMKIPSFAHSDSSQWWAFRRLSRHIFFWNHNFEQKLRFKTIISIRMIIMMSERKREIIRTREMMRLICGTIEQQHIIRTIVIH